MNKTISRFGGVALGGIFAYSGAIKLWDPGAFAVQIQAYRLLPGLWVTTLATALPIFELLTGLWLLIGRNVRPALLCSVAMALVFTAALVSVKIRGLNIECGCFGSQEGPETWLALGRDLLLLAISAFLYFRYFETVRITSSEGS